jgi:hypothetical protein
MLTIFSARRQRFCDGISRRDFLRAGALSVGGLSLTDLLRLRAHAGAPARPKSVIMVFLTGGPSHIDLYDMKPDAPVEYRGEFKPIRTNVPGIDICELMPLQAKIMDKMAILRGIKFMNPTQGHSLREVISGFHHLHRPHRPALGSVVSKLRGLAAGMPPYVSFGPTGQDEDPSYLGAAHRPYTGRGDNLGLVQGMTLDRLQDRKALLGSLDDLRRDIDAKGKRAGMDDFTKQALEIIGSGKARGAFDLNQEKKPTRERYGKATSFLLARRLIEAGVSVVTFSHGAAANMGNGWDTHGDNFKWLRLLAPELDQGLHALVTDLHDRGLSQDVVVVVWGEFGRSPKIGLNRQNGPSGREHHCDAGFALLIGGGLQMGQAIGDTGPRAERSKSPVPYTPQNVLATLYQVLGIDPALTFSDHSGRPMSLLEEREAVRELS